MSKPFMKDRVWDANLLQQVATALARGNEGTPKPCQVLLVKRFITKLILEAFHIMMIPICERKRLQGFV